MNLNKQTYKKKYSFSWLSIGNPHAIFLIKNINKIDFLQFSNKFNLKIVNICKLFYNISNKNEENKQN